MIENELFECDQCLQCIRIEDRVTHYREAHHLLTDTVTIDKCYICELEFYKRSDYIAHNKERHSNPPFKCEKLIYGEICGRVYGHLKGLINHVKKPHRKEKPFKCSECGKEYLYLKQLKLHKKENHKKSDKNLACDVMDCEDAINIGKCYICELEFTDRGDLIAHNRELHSRQPFKCEKIIDGKACGKVYCHFKDFNKHAKKMHFSEKPFKCSECVKDYHSFKQLSLHIKKVHSEKKFVCDWNECEFTTFEKYLLDRHLKRHLIPKTPKLAKKFNSDENESEKLIKCSDCDKQYKSVYSLNKHRNQIHREHKYVCDWKDCQYSTPLRGRMLAHKKRHLKVKSFHCLWPGCDSSFVDKWELYSHNIRHSDSKFCCSHCNQAFKRSESLKKHVLVVHTNERPFECEFCQRKYVTKSRLMIHIRMIHFGKQFKCDNCDYKSNDKHLIDIHNRRVHLREKTFRCYVVGCEQRRFFNKKELLAHQMSAHSDERRFVCDWPECGAAFKLKVNLSTHIKCHTGNNKPRKRKQFNK